LKLFLKHWDPQYEEEKYERIIEDFMTAQPKDEEARHDPMEDQVHERHMNEESSRVSIGDQEPPHDSIEDQMYEKGFYEDLDGESIQASISPPQDDKGLVSYGS